MGHEKRTGVPLKTGDEFDALTRFKRFVSWRPGARKFAKGVFNRRVRHRPVEVTDDGPDEGEPLA